MASKIKCGTAICKLSKEKDENGREVFYLSRGTKRFMLYDAFDFVHEKALMNMAPTEYDNRVEHWINGQWQTR